MRHRVSAVIRTHNEEKHLQRLIDGLNQQTVLPDEIIVVDSGSTDRTVDIATAAGCRIVVIDEKLFSFGRALNYGCAAATGEVLLIMSAHVYPVYDTYLENLLKGFDGSDVSVVYGRQVGDSRTKFSESRILLKWFPEESIWDQGHPFSNNANAAVRAEAWSRHPYDEGLTGLEDLAFARQVLAEGGKVAYVAEAPVVHVHEESWATVRNRYRREAIAYNKIMERSKMSTATIMRLAISNISSDYWHAIRTRNLLSNLTGIPRFRLAQFHGVWEGFNRSEVVGDDLLRRFYYPTQSSREGQAPLLGRAIDYSSPQTERP